MDFYEFLERYESYLDIGHQKGSMEVSGNVDSYALLRNSDNIIKASDKKIDPKHMHEIYGMNKCDFSGRIDHDRKVISVNIFSQDKERLNYVTSLLKIDYPNYRIATFD